MDLDQVNKLLILSEIACKWVQPERWGAKSGDLTCYGITGDMLWYYRVLQVTCYGITGVGEVDSDGKQRVCDSLIMCILTSLNQGLRNGGGIGDILRKPDYRVRYTWMIIFCVTSFQYLGVFSILVWLSLCLYIPLSAIKHCKYCYFCWWEISHKCRQNFPCGGNFMMLLQFHS